MARHFSNGILLITSQVAIEVTSYWPTLKALIFDFKVNTIFLQQIFNIIQAAPWQGDMVGIVFSATDNTWLVPDRESHLLRLVVLRILKRCQPDQSVG